jgi:hypothetical protein
MHGKDHAAMNSSITPITAASNGGEPDPAKDETEKVQPEYGVAVLRHKEGRALISLACDALGETFTLAHELHVQLYATGPAKDRDLLQLMGQALTCLETSQHYLLMLSSIVEERERTRPPGPDVDPWSVDPAF